MRDCASAIGSMSDMGRIYAAVGGGVNEGSPRCTVKPTLSSPASRSAFSYLPQAVMARDCEGFA
jgi:hypothetical protein